MRTIDGGETWIRMNTGNTSEMYRIHFVDAFTGWAVGNNSSIIKTTDGGQTWANQSSGVGTGLEDIHFPTATTGFVVGSNGVIRKTTNGGANWSFNTSGITGTIRSVWFSDANTGYFAAQTGVIRKTTNGGTSWQTVYSGTDYFKEIWFADATNGFALTPTKIFRTTNGGNSWGSWDGPEGEVIWRFQFVNATIGFASTDIGNVYKTEDGGVSWQAITIPFTDVCKSLFFLDEQHGFAGCYSGGLISRTGDGGQSWENLHSGMGDNVLGIDFRNAHTGVFVGGFGGIYKTYNGALTIRKEFQDDDIYFTAVQWMNDSIIIATGGNGIIMRSTDAGNTWAHVVTNTTSALTDLIKVDSLYAYVCGERGTILKTADAGASWVHRDIGDTLASMRGIHFLNRNYGMTAGLNRVYRTYNGGQNWELKIDSININTSFNDVWVANDTLAYVAGTFGKLYRTTNSGEWWRGVFPSGNTNAEIDEMQFINDTTGYFARLNSQSVTMNGGEQIGSESTYCLANNGGMEAIEMPLAESGSGEYGYSTGGISYMLHTKKPQSMLRTYLQDSIFCSSNRIFVGYEATGLLFSNNVFTAQISDANGNFASPGDIGSFTLVAPNTNPSGIITCTLPAGLNGNMYRIRVICVSPAMMAPDNGYNLTIQSSGIQPVISLQSSSPADCGDEPVIINASGTALGINPHYSWTINGIINSLESPEIILNDLTGTTIVSVNVTSSLTCVSPQSITEELSINVSTNPVAFAGNDVAICAGEEVIIGSDTENDVQWTPSAGLNNSLIAQPVAGPADTTLYVLTVTNSGGCSDSDTVFVFVAENPEIFAGIDTAICEGSAVIIGSPTQNTVQWEPSSTLDNATLAQPTAAPAVTTSYFLTSTNLGGCISRDTVTIQLNENPEIFAGNDTSVCFGEEVTIGSLTIDEILWYPTEGLNDPEISQPDASPEISTLYIITATNELGCISQDDVFITVNQNPALVEIIFTADGLVAQGFESGTITWYFNDSIIVGKNNDTLPVFSPGNYHLIVESEFGCSISSDTLSVETVGNYSTEHSKLILNRNGDNWYVGGFSGHTGNLNYSIYDMSGRKLLQNSAVSNSNGIIRLDGISLPKGIYILQLFNDTIQESIKVRVE